MTSLSSDNWVYILSYFDPDLTLSWLLKLRSLNKTTNELVNNNHNNFLNHKLVDWNFYFNDSGLKKFHHKTNVNYISNFYLFCGGEHHNDSICETPSTRIQWMNTNLFFGFESFLYTHIENFYSGYLSHDKLQNIIFSPSFNSIKKINYATLNVSNNCPYKNFAKKTF